MEEKIKLSNPMNDDFSTFLKVDKAVRKVLRFFCYLSAIALLVIMFVAFFNVIGEKLQKAGVAGIHGIKNSTYIIQYFHIPLVFLAAGWVTLDQGHTRIDLLIHKFPKVEKICMFIGHIMGAGVSFYISYCATFTTLANDFARNTRITTNFWPEWPFTLCHCLGFFLLGCSFIWALVRMVRFWKYEGVNPGVYLYPNEHHAPGEDAPSEEGGEK